MKFENPWWASGKIDDYYGKMKRREYFQLFHPLVLERSVKRAMVLMGPRRVGKTVMLYHSIDELLSNEIPQKQICYFSIETPLYNGIALEELLNLYIDLHQFDVSKELYVFFDEIQYLKDWELHLKSLVDSYHNFKFIVSGSAAAALKLKSQESGAGRFTEFLLPPLTFHEFLLLTDNDHLIQAKENTINADEFKIEYNSYEPTDIVLLNEKFIDYINYGGYPEVSLSETIQSDPGRYIRNDIIDKVLMRDLPSLYGISDIQELNSLFTYIAYNSGNEMSLEGIASNSGVAKNTIKKYLGYLEAAFLIKTIHRIDQNGKKFKRANFFKVYLTNPSLRSALFSPIQISDEFIGNMVETAIFSQWQHNYFFQLFYARWQNGEVDLVHMPDGLKFSMCLEIKWSNRFVDNPHELKSAIHFCKRHKISQLKITTIDITEVKKYQNIDFHFVPASLYAYEVGRNSIWLKQGFS
ncbi:ATP-binding protein [Reichenbachiella faecimaris]|nr:ATP-binding protein [Reichenbachiella faecimaris]